jgi:hypothetical protein
MTSKQIIARIWDTPGAFESVKRNYTAMLGALLEIGLDWEGDLKASPWMKIETRDLNWLSMKLKHITGMTWEELTNDK